MKELADLFALPDGARMRHVDLHVHTPASRDMDPKWSNLEPKALLVMAQLAGLQAIAITDHNSVDWCDRMGQAAQGTGVVVMPGVEVSTREGHLLAIFEAGKAADEIREFLVQVGFGRRTLETWTSSPTLQSPKLRRRSKLRVA